MKYTTNAINILTIQTFKGIGRAWIVKNLRGNESTDTIVEKLNMNSKEGLVTISEFKKRREAVGREILKLEGHLDGIVALGDNLFPPYRGEVKNSDRACRYFLSRQLKLIKFRE